MTDKKASANEARGHTDDPPRVHRTTGGSWTGFLAHRWPIALGIAIAVLAVLDMTDGTEFAAFTVLMPLAYLGAATLDRRRFAWAVLLAGIAVLAIVPLASEVVPSVGFLVVALLFLVLGVARGRSRNPGGLRLQTAGMLVFGSTVLVALYMDPDLGGKLVAFALIGHAAWDAFHFLQDRVVSRSYAEFCAVVDLLLGAAILFMT